MGELTAVANVTLDGVIQAPGGAEEDTRGGFEHGGWAQPYQDPVMMEAMAPGMSSGGALLFGRRTHEQFAAYWPKQTDGNPFTEVLDRSTKYVASRTLGESPPWQNSVLLEGDAADAVAELKASSAEDMMILGSGDLLQSLMPRGLVDVFVLSIHPLVLGEGRRLFAGGATYGALELIDSRPTTTGVIIATYRAVG